MSYIFMDESGDLGFNRAKVGTSKNFIITLVSIGSKKSLENIVKNIFKKMTKHELKHHDSVIHAYKELPKTRYRILNCVQKIEDLTIMYIYLNKSKVYTNLQDEKHLLYNYVTNILLDRIYTKKLISTKSPIKLIVEQRETNKFLNKNFENYLNTKVKNNGFEIGIQISKPHKEKGLQIADIISWSIFRAHEHGDRSYIEKIEDKIIEGSCLFK